MTKAKSVARTDAMMDFCDVVKEMKRGAIAGRDSVGQPIWMFDFGRQFNDGSGNSVVFTTADTLAKDWVVIANMDLDGGIVPVDEPPSWSVHWLNEHAARKPEASK